MKKLLKNIIMYLPLLTFFYPDMIRANDLITIYSDAENGGTDGWVVDDNDPKGAVIRNVYDPAIGSRVIELRGNGFENSFLLKRKDGNYWYNTNQFILQWDMKTDQYVRVFVYIMTYKGFKFLYYDTSNIDSIGDEDYIHYSLGEQAADNKWHTFTRDLRADLRSVQPDNDILSVEWFGIRGSAKIDNVVLKNDKLYKAPEKPSNLKFFIENGGAVKLVWTDNSEEENNYKIYKNGKLIAILPPNSVQYTDKNVEAGVSYLYEVEAVNDKGSSKEQISVTVSKEFFPPKAPSNLFASITYRTIELRWDDNSDNENGFEIYRNGKYLTQVPANTTRYTDEWVELQKSYKYEVYAFNSHGRSKPVSLTVTTGKEIYKPTAPSNLSAVLENPTTIKLTWKDNSRIETAYKIIRNGRLLAVLQPDTTQFKDISIQSNTYYTYEVVASNSIGDSKAVKVTIKTPSSLTNRDENRGERVYEDAEDGTTNKWVIYSDPENTAEIRNVFDFERQSRVIEFTSKEYENGYWLKNSDGSLWNDTDHTFVEWKSKFRSGFLVYIYVKTTKGDYYLQYIPVSEDIKIGGKLNFALGTEAKDGKWHTFKRDIKADLAKATDYDPEISLISIEGFLVRGNGRVDDIKTLNQ